MQQSYLASLEEIKRLCVKIHGAVQGVGFRPFVYRLAKRLALNGWVSNSSSGVLIEVEGSTDNLNIFLLALEKEKPERSAINSLEFSFLDPQGHTGFKIIESSRNDDINAFVLPEIATCEDCYSEVFDTENRRYLYPFTNCTNCGPRFSIIDSLPYDRNATSMKSFAMCIDCQNEYENPADRRFHAQPNACPVCGPSLKILSAKGESQKVTDPMQTAASAVRSGLILALKGVGGFHLIVDSRNNEAIMLLRKRKAREEKPFALMFPSLEIVKEHCLVNTLEERLLLSPESPIVLLKKKKESKELLSNLIAPENQYLGVMLPYTPLHKILLEYLGFPVVATSANISDEPIVTDENDAINRLNGIADMYLVNDRPILRHVDDSLARIILGKEHILRRARGYAPLPLRNGYSEHTGSYKNAPGILAVGAHLKNTVSITIEDQIFISQHIGDLETEEAHDAFQKVIEDFKKLFDFEPEFIACDMHPDYISTKYAKTIGLQVIEVQHHHAHVAACMSENDIRDTVLGVCWDGTGYGTDGTIWGGEFLVADYSSFRRACHFRKFRIPGGDKAVREPRRSAIGILHEIYNSEGPFGNPDFKYRSYIKDNFTDEELRIFRKMIENGLHSPLTSSAGRIFDAVSSILGLRQKVNYEGQAATELEGLATDDITSLYPFEILKESSATPAIRASDSFVVDWSLMFLSILDDKARNMSGNDISTKFHNTLTEIIISVANLIGIEKVALTGGVFQNRYLTERACKRLFEEGFKPYIHQRVPANDGGISYGQAVVASAFIMGENKLSNSGGEQYVSCNTR